MFLLLFCSNLCMACTFDAIDGVALEMRRQLQPDKT